jgi:hypothetical protein
LRNRHGKHRYPNEINFDPDNADHLQYIFWCVDPGESSGDDC